MTEVGSEKKSSAARLSSPKSVVGEASRTAYSQHMEVGKKADLAAFRRLISEGRLYELLDWIEAGKPVRFIARYEKPISGLEISVPHGDYAELIKSLLKQGARWNPGSGNLRHSRNGLVSGDDD